MSDPKCARMMLNAAEKDLRSMRLLEEEGPEESFGFHLQQAVEKAFKAWVAVLGGLYELTHDLNDLLKQLEDCGADLRNLDRFRALARFTPYAVEYRYEGVAEWVEPIDRTAAIALVAELLEHVGAALDAIEQ